MKKTRMVNVALEIVIDVEAQKTIDSLVSECMAITGMTEEQCRILVDVIIDMGFKSNPTYDLKTLLHSTQMFLDMFAARLGLRTPF